MKTKAKPKAVIPEELAGDALLAWNEFCADAADYITPADRAAMILLCNAWAEMKEAARQIEAKGTVIKLPNGYPGPNPYCKVRNEARACVMKLITELGLTPNSRSRIKANGAAADDDDDDDDDLI